MLFSHIELNVKKFHQKNEIEFENLEIPEEKKKKKSMMDFAPGGFKRASLSLSSYLGTYP